MQNTQYKPYENLNFTSMTMKRFIESYIFETEIENEIEKMNNDDIMRFIDRNQSFKNGLSCVINGETVIINDVFKNKASIMAMCDVIKCMILIATEINGIAVADLNLDKRYAEVVEAGESKNLSEWTGRKALHLQSKNHR